MLEINKLYRNQSNRMIGGVAAGIANNLGVDVTLVRLIFVALTLAQGLGIVIYLILWLVLPSDTALDLTGEATVRHNLKDMAGSLQAFFRRIRASESSSILLALMLIGLGSVVLLNNLNIHWLHTGLIWPLLFILLGGYLLSRR